MESILKEVWHRKIKPLAQGDVQGKAKWGPESSQASGCLGLCYSAYIALPVKNLNAD